MKSPLRLLRNPLVALAALAGASAFALTPTEWRYRQPLTVAAPGLVRVELPEVTFDGAQGQLQDLRVLDPDGREVALLLDRPTATPPRTARPESFTERLDDGVALLTLNTGTNEPLVNVTLETAHPAFVRAVRVEASEDGRAWTLLDDGVPIFRQWGAEKLSVPLGGRRAAWLRLSVQQRGGVPLAFTGAQLTLAAAAEPEPVPVSATIAARDEFAGETVLTVNLAARHLPLAALEFETADPLFMRHVSVAVRVLDGTTATERVLGSGTIYRVALDGAAPRAQLSLPLRATPDTAELIVHIQNGDSPPLALSAVRAKRLPLNLYFHAAAAGRFTLLSGNAQAAPAHYDLAAFAGDVRHAAATAVAPGAREDMPDYHPRENLAAAPLPEIPLLGAQLDLTPWTRRRPLTLSTAGVQEIELDLPALAHARPDFADLRVIRADHQIPYLLEPTTLARALPLTPVGATDAKRPNVSVWQLALPHAGTPLRRITLTTSTPLFQREFRLYERVPAADGHTYDHTLATGSWQRTPEPGAPASRTFEISERPITDTLLLETNDGDNPPIALDRVVAAYPVTRLIFKTGETDGYELAYGNPQASTPRYDLGLVAARLLTAPRHAVALGADNEQGPGFLDRALKGANGGFVFWAALGLVVVVLLVVVARLLPKPPAA